MKAPACPRIRNEVTAKHNDDVERHLKLRETLETMEDGEWRGEAERQKKSLWRKQRAIRKTVEVEIEEKREMK